MLRKSKPNEKGAAAVEFALVVPVLLALVFGIIEFGLVYNFRTQLNNAAMTGARHYSLHHNVGQAQNAVRSVVSLPSGTPISITVRNPSNVVVSSCPTVEAITKNTVTVEITAIRPAVTNMFGSQFTIPAKATAVCM